MENKGLNFEQLHTFFKGYKKDRDNNFEEFDTYQKSINLRLYSENGVLSLKTLEGTRKVYENQSIIEYVGWYSFIDELIVFTKTNLPIPEINYDKKLINELVLNENFETNGDPNLIEFPLEDMFTEIEYEIDVLAPIENPELFEQQLSCTDQSEIEDGNYLDLFQQSGFNPITICDILGNKIPINNEVYSDGIWSLKFNEENELVGNLIWLGYLNLEKNAKIITEGVYENEFYKRVYFTDYLNTFRSINLKDRDLNRRQPEELQVFPSGILLNPQLKQINETGSLNAMTVMYMYRLITENGQVTDYSPFSQAIKIVKNTNGHEFAGGDIKETTNKSVTVYCLAPNHVFFKEIELISIEFEAENVPTTIRLVDKKPVTFYNEFLHTGNEQEFLQNITLADIFENKIGWKYCSDLSRYNNKLLISAPRNNPSYVNNKNIGIDFSLNGFDVDGETHSCLLNPDPGRYQYIKNNFQKFKYVKRKLFRNIKVFGSFKVQLKNTLTGQFFEKTFTNSVFKYENFSNEIFDFLNTLESEALYTVYFPNLNIEQVQEGFVFKPIDPLIQTDFYYYNLVFSTNQVIIDVDNDMELLTWNWPITNFNKEFELVYGAVSNGYFTGNGVKVTTKTELDFICERNTDWHDGQSSLIKNLQAPSLKKGFMKGEIYRLGIAWYKDGNRLFTTILGDFKIPEIGMPIRELNDLNQVNFSQTNFKYQNTVIGVNLEAQRIVLEFDVRINCELSKEVDAYQIVYVERTENNRTILAQGLTQPTERILPFELNWDVDTKLPEIIANKWRLPQSGGPVYDSRGLINYDDEPNNENPALYGSFSSLPSQHLARVVTNRKLVSFDCPDLNYLKISDQFINSAKVEFVQTLATDHDRHNILGGYDRETAGLTRGTRVVRPDGSTFNGTNSEEVADFGTAKFSQKIPYKNLGNTEDARPHYVNVSVFGQSNKSRFFSNRFSSILPEEYKYSIEKSKLVEDGKILSGSQLNETFQVSNNAINISCQAWYFNVFARTRNHAGYSLFRPTNHSSGRRTCFIKTETNLYSDSNISQEPFEIRCRVNMIANGQPDGMNGNDSHIIVNLKRNNESSVYGGKSNYAYTVNEYIPLSEVIPVLNQAIFNQKIKVEGDTYTTLYLRSKTHFKNSLVPDLMGMKYWNNSYNTYNRYSTWTYGVILESTVEPRLNNSDEFYRISSNINFFYDEKMNGAYFQENDLRKSLPVPYNFKDDPNQNSSIAASETKLSGDFIDNWSVFKPNEFYELDKDKGTAFNFGLEKDKLFVIQELQTSAIQIDERAMINPTNGEPIQIAQGSGNSISGHVPVSYFGTSFRRAVIKSDFGFVFFDERKNEFVKIIEPLLIKNELSLEYEKFFKLNKILDVEGYYDNDFKETQIRFKTTTNKNFVLSYNEVMGCFNGEYEYDNDLYIPFQQKILSPTSGNILEELNSGRVLEFFGESKCFVLGIVSAPNFNIEKIIKQVSLLTNSKYPIEAIKFTTSLDQQIQVYSHHPFYKIEEGRHRVPAKNVNDFEDIRGNWVYIELKSKAHNFKSIKFTSIIVFVRKSYK